MIKFSRNDIEKFIALNKDIENDATSRGMKKLLEVYNKISIFKGLNKIDLQAVLYDVTFKKYTYKEIIFKEGEVLNDIYYIISGEVEMVKHNKKISTLKTGQTFGEIGMLLDERTFVSIVCKSQEAVVLSFKIDYNNIEFSSKTLVKIYQNILHQLKNKLKQIDF
jgi:CRP-like cAMP-binding protein